MHFKQVGVNKTGNQFDITDHLGQYTQKIRNVERRQCTRIRQLYLPWLP